MTFNYDAANIHIIFELSHLSALFINNMYEQQSCIYDKRARSVNVFSEDVEVVTFLLFLLDIGYLPYEGLGRAFPGLS